MAMRLSGLMSGMDTESIVTQLVEARKAKVTTAVKAQKSLSFKQEAWKSLNTQILKLYDGALSNLRFSSAYMKKTTKVSNSSVASVITNEGAMNSVQELEVVKLAKSGYMTGGKLELVSGASSSEIKGDTRLSEIGLNIGLDQKAIIKVKVGSGEMKEITVTRASTIDEFVSQLRGAGVSANFDANNGRIYVAGNATGVENDFKILGGNGSGWLALNALGLNDTEHAAGDIAEERISAIENLKKLASGNSELKIKLRELGIDFEKDKDKWNFDIDPNLSEEEKAEKQREMVKKLNETLDATTVQNIRLAVNNTIASYPQEDSTVKSELTRWRDGFIETEKLKTAYDRMDKENIAKERADAIDSLKVLAGKYSDLAAELTKAGVNVDNLTVDNLDRDTRDKIQIAFNYAMYALDEDSEEGKAKRNELAQWDENFQEIEAFKTASEQMDPAKSATKIEATDAVITLNGLEYTSSKNTFEVNGLTITASDVGKATLTTQDDTDGIYDMIKNFFKEYNELINQMDKLYNADSASEYEPLTDEEKAEMSDSAVEQWEQKIKDSILRRDSSLNSIANAMKQVMMEGVEVNGKKMYLSNFGIETLSYFTAAENEKNAYHIDGNSDDASVSGNADKLKSMIASDPDTVVAFFTKLSQTLYGKMTDLMAGTEYSSAYTAYEDKRMKTEYDEYTSKIKELEKKLADYEDQWYAKFAAMETAMAKLQSNASAVTSLLGG